MRNKTVYVVTYNDNVPDKNQPIPLCAMDDCINTVRHMAVERRQSNFLCDEHKEKLRLICQLIETDFIEVDNITIDLNPRQTLP